MPYLYLLLSSICSLTLVHLLKVTEVKKLRTVQTLTINYLAAGLAALVIGAIQSVEFHFVNLAHPLILAFCFIVGALFIGNFFIYSKSIHVNGMGISVAAMRLSLLVPVMISVYLYNEFLSAVKVFAIVLVFGALLLLIPRREKIRFRQINAGWLLLAVFMLTGLADASLKVYEEEFRIQFNELIFMGVVFAGAFIIGLATCFYRRSDKQLINTAEVKLGTLIGIPNLYSSVFLIYALEEISGAIAFSMVNIMNVVGGTALGLIRWQDEISTRQWIGLAIAIVAIILLL